MKGRTFHLGNTAKFPNVPNVTVKKEVKGYGNNGEHALEINNTDQQQKK